MCTHTRHTVYMCVELPIFLQLFHMIVSLQSGLFFFTIGDGSILEAELGTLEY